MKLLISTSAPAKKNPIAEAKASIAEAAKQIKVLQKQMDDAQKIIDKEADRIDSEKRKAAQTAAKQIQKANNVLFVGKKGNGIEGRPNASLTIVARNCWGNGGKVYALAGKKRTYIAQWTSKTASGQVIKGYRLAFTTAGKKYASLYKA